MADSASIKFDERSIAQFTDTVNAMIRVTRKDAKYTIMDVAKRAYSRLASATPLASKSTSWMWRTVGLAGHKIPFMVPKRNTPGRGFAKAGWAKAGAKLGRGSARKYGTGAPGAWIDQLNDPDSPMFSLINRVPFIESLDAGGLMPDLPTPGGRNHSAPPANILTKAFAGLNKDMAKKLDRMRKNWAKEWGR